MSQPSLPARIAHFSYVAPLVAWGFFFQRPAGGGSAPGNTLAWVGILALCAAGLGFAAVALRHARETGAAHLRWPALCGLGASLLTLVGVTLASGACA